MPIWITSGRDDFEEISNHLYRELLAYRIVNDSFEWDQIQVRFWKTTTITAL